MNTAQHAWSWLTGKKTYLFALAAPMYAWGIQHGLWTHDPLVDTLIGGGLAASLRHGWKTEAAKIVEALATDPAVLAPGGAAIAPAAPASAATSAPAAAAKVASILGILGLSAALMFGGACGKTLESGGAYAPVGTNGVATVAPDYDFFIADSGFDLAYSTIDGILKFERDNRVALFKISPTIKHDLDKIRPDVKDTAQTYLKLRQVYMANPIPANLSTLQTILAKAQQLATTAAAALPPGTLAGQP